MNHPTSKFKYRILFYLFISLLGSGIITATLLIIFSYLHFYAVLSERLRILLLSCIFLLFLFVIFAKLTDMSFLYMRKLTMAMNQIAQGNFDVAIPIEQDDELGYIAHHINMMARQLRAARVKEQRSIEKERLANLTLYQEEQTKHDLITNVAHDLRTPLTSMIGYLQLLIETPDLDQETKNKYLHIAYDKSQRLNHLLDDLFDFASLSSQQIRFQESRLNISELVSQIADEFYPVFKSHHLKLNLTVSHPALFVMGDGNLLARVFDNLISNAIKYSQEGKAIDIQISHDEPSVTIKIINDGPDLSREELDHLFEKFYRADSSRSSHTGGTGLGLAIAKSIVEMHNGEIFATSRHGKISFIVVLKRADEAH